MEWSLREKERKGWVCEEGELGRVGIKAGEGSDRLSCDWK